MSRVINLKAIPLIHDAPDGADLDRGDVFSFKLNLLQILRAPKDPQAGISLAEMEEMLPLIGKVKAVPVNGDLKLSEAEHIVIRDRVEKWKFGVSHDAIWEFIAAMRNPPNVGAE